MTCFHFYDKDNYRCNFHGDKAKIISPKNQLCEDYQDVSTP